MTEPTTEQLEDGSVRVKLETPIQAHGEEVTELVLRTPTVRHLKVMDRATGDVERAIVLIAELGQVPPSSVEAITNLRDFGRLSKVVEGFLSDTGLTASGSEA